MEVQTKTRWLHVRLSAAEYQLLHDNFKKTTCRKLSEYARNILFQRPMIKAYRDRSLDDFMGEMMRLRTELNHLGNNFNQAVKKLHTANVDADYRNWLRTFEIEKHTLNNKIEQINGNIQKFAERWLQ
ncbi:plasmid mobilization protein [Pedobacter sp.]|uniref:plasmid mobilization protein n=1 Tax=Pedobacter sp. TaxID=1411316 RepID=UPI00396C582E